jgi:hypothetical protein
MKNKNYKHINTEIILLNYLIIIINMKKLILLMK